jgi:hypothetical protein
MSTFDPQQHDLRLNVLVMGGASDLFLRGVPMAEGELKLGEVQGWHPRIQFHGFGVDPWTGDGAERARLEQLVPMTDGLVLTDALVEGTHYSSSAVERLSRLLRPMKIGLPTAIFGGPALALEWSTLSGVAPVHVTDPVLDNVMPTVKALLKLLLKKQTGKSIPPP